MSITVYDKSYPQYVAVTVNNECNHNGEIIVKDYVNWSATVPSLHEIDVCDKCGEAV